MATAGGNRMEGLPRASPQRQQSPGAVRSSAFGFSGVAPYWAQQGYRKHGVNSCQAGWRLDPGGLPVQRNLHPMLHPQQPAGLSYRVAPAARMPPSRPADSGPLAQEAAPRLRENSPQPCSPLLWRSMTPATFLFNGGCRSPQQAPRPASTGTRGAASGAHRLQSRPMPERPPSQSQLRNFPAVYWQGRCTQQASGVPASVQQFLGNQQQSGRIAHLNQQGNQMEHHLGTQRQSSLHARLSKFPSGVTSSPDPKCPPTRDQPTYAYPPRSVPTGSPPPKYLRPLSVPPQGYRGMGIAASSPSGGHQSADGARIYGPPVSRSPGMQVEFKKNRSFSTPPLASRQSPSLASRFWALFQTPAGQTGSGKESHGHRASDAGLFATIERNRQDQRVTPTVSWAYQTRENLQQMQRGAGNNQQGIRQASSGGPNGSPALSLRMDLVRSPRHQPSTTPSQTNAACTPMYQRETVHKTTPMDTRAVSQTRRQQEAAVQQVARTVLPTSQQQPDVQPSQPSTHPSPQTVQQHQLYGSQQQRDYFLWQQQQLLRRQQEVLQQQKEKLLQQQASLQQQKQRQVVRSELTSQSTSQPPEQQKAQETPTKGQMPEYIRYVNPTGASCAHGRRENQPVPPMQKRELSFEGQQTARDLLGAEMVSASSLRGQMHPAQAPASAHYAASQGIKPSQEEPTVPPPLEWQLNQPANCPGGPAGSPGPAAAETRNLSFSAVGGSLEQRMQLTCEVLVDPAAKLNKAASALSGTTANAEATQAQCPSQPETVTEGRAGSPQEKLRPKARFEEPVAEDQPAGSATAPVVRSPSDVAAASTDDDLTSNAAESDASAVVGATDVARAQAEQLAGKPRSSPQEQPPVSSSSSHGTDTHNFTADAHDIIPVGRLIAAVAAAGGWGGDAGNSSETDEWQEGAKNIEDYLPIKSLSELESVEKDHEADDVLDLRRDIVGCGTYGVVRKLRHRKGGFVVAVKSIQKETVVRAGMVNQVEFELYVQRDLLRHQNVLPCFACVEDAEYLHMVLGYCEYGDLYRRIREQPNRRFSELEAFCFFAQLVNGLQCVHSSGIIHRDLKLENLLLTKGNVLKIADFGWCGSVVGRSRSFSFCGTLDYLAPEMVKGQGHDWRVDIWSLGVLLYELLDGRPPFQSTRHFELVQRIVTVDIRMPSHVASDAADLIRKLLKYEPSERLALVEIAQHPWVLRMWRELQLHLLQLDPAADLEALVPIPSEPAPALGAELLLSSHILQAETGSSNAVAKGLDGPIRNEISRSATKYPPGSSRQQLPAAKPLNLPPVSGRRNSRGVNFVLVPGERPVVSASSDKSTKRGASASRLPLASPAIQPRRRTLPKAVSLPAQPRAARSTNKAPPLASARQMPAARSSEAAEASAAQSSAKKGEAKWRPMSFRQRSRGRTAPLVDQSFDFPNPVSAAEAHESNAARPQADPPTSAVQTGETGSHRQAERVETFEVENVSSFTDPDFKQRLTNMDATCDADDRHQMPSESPRSQLLLRPGVTFCLDGQSKEDPAHDNTHFLPTLEEDAGTVNHATTLPSLKKLRSVSTRPRSYGPGGAVLRVRSNTSGLSAAKESEKAGASSICLRPGSHDQRGALESTYGDPMSFPRGEQQRWATLGSLCSTSVAGVNVPNTSSAISTNPVTLASAHIDFPGWRGAPLAQPDQPYSQQRFVHHMVQQNSLSRLQAVSNFPTNSSASLHGDQQRPIGPPTAFPTAHGGIGGRPALHRSYQRGPMQRLGDIAADIPAVKHLHSPAHSKTVPETNAATSRPPSSPTDRGIAYPPRMYPPGCSLLASNGPSSASEFDNGVCASQLPVIFAGAPNTNSPKFLSNPGSLFG